MISKGVSPEEEEEGYGGKEEGYGV